MEFAQVIYSHVNWRKQYCRHLEGQERLDVAVVAKDTHCEFGKWLYGEGREHKGCPEYLTALEKHKVFHTVAAQTLQQAETMTKEKAMDMVGLRSSFTHASTECVAALCALRDAVKGHDHP